MDCSHFVLFLGGRAPISQFDGEHLKYMLNDIKQIPQEIQEEVRKVMQKHMHAKVEEKLGRMKIPNEYSQAILEELIFEWSTEQVHIVMANMFIAATMMGINTCAVGGFYSLDILESILRDEAQIDTNKYTISLMAAFGYEKEPSSLPKRRRDIGKVLTYI